MKSFRSNAHDSHGVAIHFDLPAYDGRIAVEAFFPVVIAEHDDVFSPVLLRLRAINQPARGGLESKRGGSNWSLHS